MKKILMLIAAVLVFQATPAFAEDTKARGEHKGKMFSSKDTNGDGVLSESEFLDHAKKKFAEIDSNGDGSVSPEEGKAAHKAKREKMKEKRQERREKRSDSGE